MESIGIIGSGVAGLGCAYGLRGRARVTVLEKDPRFGGHTNTRTILEDGAAVPIDTGFIVFNKVTYPNLLKLFRDLDIAIKPAEMSFAVRHDPDDLEYNGAAPGKVFAQRGNLLRPAFYRFLADVLRFFRVARSSLGEGGGRQETLREFCGRHKLGAEFQEWYLAPMSSAVWSTDPAEVMGFPARTLVRFFYNHGFLGVTTHHRWFTVDGGAKTYVDKILALPGIESRRFDARLVQETADGVVVRAADGEALRFDRVVLAAHADQSLALLERPDREQAELLAPFRYQKNHATLHTYPGFLPRRRRAWASWNFLVRRAEEKPGAPPEATVHYWMNALQGVSQKKDYFVSLNCSGRVPPEHVLYETLYEHPVFNLATESAQVRLPSLNRRSPRQRLYFCGSYFRYGFHEDAYSSAVELAEVLRGHLDASRL